MYVGNRYSGSLYRLLILYKCSALTILYRPAYLLQLRAVLLLLSAEW